MTTTAIMMVRNEIDLLPGVVLHTLGEVDNMIIADNLSTDGTTRMLHLLAASLPITVIDDTDPAYTQSQKMTRLAAMAADRGAEWIVPVDADELWYTCGGRIRDLLADCDSSTRLFHARLFNHFSTLVDPYHEDPFRRLEWRQETPAALGKVAFRWEDGATIAMGNHSVDLPSQPTPVGGLDIRHFPYRTPEQFIAKALQGAAALALTDLPESTGAHWRGYARIHQRLGDQGLVDVWNEHFRYSAPWESGLIRDPAPYRRFEGEQ